MFRGPRPIATAAVLAALVASGCLGDDDATEPATVTAAASETVVLGQLPESPTPLAPPVAPATVPTSTTTVYVEPVIEPITGPIGEVVDGNRLLLIGDTGLARLTERQDGTACPVIADAGWQVRIEAEVGRFLTFADLVVDRLLVDSNEEWDVIGLMFGLHVDTSAEEFGSALDRVIERLDGRPVLLYSVAERAEPDDESDELAVGLNEQIRALDERHPNVVLIDWAIDVNEDDSVNLVDRDRVPTTAGDVRLVEYTLEVLGPYPPDPAADGDGDDESDEPDDEAVGACLEAFYTDDSAILL